MIEVIISFLVVLLIFTGIYVIVRVRDPYRRTERVVRRVREPMVERDDAVYVKVPRAAEIAGVSRHTVWRWAKKGRVRSKRRGRLYLVAIEDVVKKAREKR